MIYYNNGRVSSRPYTYRLLVDATEFPITLDEVKNYLRIDLLNTDEDALLNLMISAVTDYFEEYTGKILINKSFRTYRDNFCDSTYLKKSRLFSIIQVNYYNKDNALTLIPTTTYSNTFEEFYSQLYLKPGESWPTDIGRPLQGIEIDFIAGYGDNASSVPTKIKIGLLQHIAMMYENRGDCETSSDCGCSKFLPAVSKSIYNLFKIRELVVQCEC